MVFFFQDKTIRQTALRTAGELALVVTETPVQREALAKQQIAWTGTIARWESEPETQEGRRELMRRATDAEKKRVTALAKYHHFEMASAAFQIAIVIVSASVITGVALLAIGGSLNGVITGPEIFAPHAIHVF